MINIVGVIGTADMDDVIIFEVSDEKVFTFDGLTRSNSVNFADVNVLNKKPLSIYMGETLDTMNFTIRLKDYWGVDPRTEMNKLIYIQRDGVPISFLLDGKGFGRYRWTIRELEMKFSEIDNKGVYHCIDLDVSMTEYARGNEGLKSPVKYYLGQYENQG